ncbi:endolytic transglycosylase MltG [Streptomyces sp. NPDC090022]|uniref:endolytic transglycosylase MltG n=1 Tax=Streptomyces sp. NPDC090022 TaxID=3365920 RepID=UPI0037FCF1CA
MTEYGRGQAPEPWHPEDPLYGDPGWTGQHQVPQHHAQEPQYQQQYPQEYQGQQYQQQQPYPEQYQAEQYHAEQYPQHQQQAYPQMMSAPQQTYGAQVWDTGQMIGQAAQPQTAYPQAPQAVADPYVGPDAYGGADPYGQQPAVYPGETADLYATPEAYPPPVPPHRRAEAEEQAEEWQDEVLDDSTALGHEDDPRPAGDGDDDGAEAPAAGRRADRASARGGKGKAGKGKGKGKKKSRNGVACLFTSMVLLGIVGGGGYYGYSFIENKFGADADFTGAGTDPIDVEIPNGSGLGEMGRILKAKGVVASAGAFVSAAQAHPKGGNIQPGLYPLRKQMSAREAVELMTDPSKLNVVTIAEGMRNAAVYQMIDKKLKLSDGTTQETAKRELKNLGLPAWADSDNPKMKDPLEGFLYPARYDLAHDMKPEDLLKKMVAKANESYAAHGVEAKSKALGLSSPLQLVTVASLVQAEGMNHDDFKRMSEVIYNRLKPTNDVTNQKLEFDSTINYLKGTSNINVSRSETRTLDNPYNTYFYKGLTPGPIGNPGDDAVNAALNPDGGGWMFFVSVDGKKTTFTQTFDEHEKLVAEFNERQKKKSGG